MSEMAPEEMEQHLPGYEAGGGELGVMDATRMGWRLMMTDFWPIWLVGLVAYAIQGGVAAVGGMVGVVPLVGPPANGCIQLVAGIFLIPPLMAGLIYALARVIDGQQAEVGQVFEGFRERYWPSVVAMLLPNAIGFVGGALAGGVMVGAAVIGGESGRDEEAAIALGIAGLIVALVAIILVLVMLLFTFTLVAVWDHPQSGWQAMKQSVRIVKQHYLSTLGLALLFGVIGLGGALAGAIACCVGVLFTMPVVLVWLNATLIYLYRSWTGRPLVQQVAETSAGEGPVAPSDVEPPPPPPEA